MSSTKMSDFEVLTPEKFDELKKQIYNEAIEYVLKLPRYDIRDDGVWMTEEVGGEWVSENDIRGLRK